MENAPKITQGQLNDIIEQSNIQYHVFPETTTTICCITLPNGFTLVGKSACVSPDNFDAKTGREIALADAGEQLWPLEGYLLAHQMKAGNR